MNAFTVTGTSWTIFQYDLAQQQRGAPCMSGAQIVQAGNYILLSDSKWRIDSSQRLDSNLTTSW